jgi:hypothetical protein
MSKIQYSDKNLSQGIQTEIPKWNILFRYYLSK